MSNPNSFAPPPPTPTATRPTSSAPFKRGPSPSDLALHQLALDAQGGQEGALRRLLDVLRADLPRQLRRDIARRGFRLCDDDVDEVVQGILIGVWTTDLARFDRKRGSFGGFMRKRVRWALMDHVRGLARRLTAPLHDDVSAKNNDPISLLERAEREKILARVPAFAQAVLTNNDDSDPLAKLAIVGKDLNGVELRHLAAAVGRHPSTLTRARQRGLVRVRSRIAPVLERASFAEFWE